MKQELTKNVSISSGEVSAEVINAAFFALLSREGLYVDYFHYWTMENRVEDGLTILQAWEDWAKVISPWEYIKGAFWWDFGPLRFKVWADLNYKWTEWLAANLNK